MEAAALVQGLSLKDLSSSASCGYGGSIIRMPSMDKTSCLPQPLLMRSSSKLLCSAVASKSSPNLMKEAKRGLYRPFPLSPELKAFVGEDEMSRAEVIQKLWVYIRENNLQDSENRRKIRCNEALRSLFDIDTVDMLQMSKLISKHILVSVGPDGLPKPKKPKATGATKKSPIFTPQPISKELQTFLGLSETELVRSTATKMIWSYIKENNLQDPANKRNVICDSKLRELFKCESFVGISVTKLLVPHFPKDDTM
ncbi:hypothetical protein O6H91_20G074800 [Diphasiastrum complanatum]|uniref:Uncharacterized protein n=1 Tax=Diphasiastrum complanatum TaxID=34168 RepID=A0ACC2AT95_DIPCM|nr:hypothetical protein O6H91_20G074800 [Diphasiastrum complanatum]